ncbi:O-antigen ligase domain-containing protein [Paraclostridium sordellii 8483]|uniref:O-antigen ligase family protein n=1 Tax=Paraclostridium sordellii TaxID=1505 RepID=UPI0002EBBD32|nr:O-antigen ligase family protein [Paeniclostridium sordellii]TAN67482.1 O-antigen ligase domain-containing protein [Paeniclostridium sordellii 8483]
MKYIKEVKEIEAKFIFLLSILWIGYSFLFDKYSYSIGIIFSVLYIVIFININLQKKLYLIVFTLPFTSIFKISPSLPSIMIILYGIYIFDTIVIKKKSVYLIDVISIIGVIVFQIIGVSIYNGSIVAIMSFSLNIIFMRLCILNLKGIKDSKKSEVLLTVSLVFGISMILSIILADIFPRIPYIVLPEKQSLLMSINRFNGLNGDPNYYSQLVLVSISLLLAAINLKISNKLKIIMIIMTIFLIISGYRSISKSYALTSIILLILFFIYLVKKIIKVKTAYKNILLLIIVAFISLISLYFLIGYIVIPLIKSRTDSGDFLTGRGDIWVKYIEMIKMDPLVILNGAGFSNSGNVLFKFFGYSKSPHNVYIEILVEIGIVGITFILIILRDIIWKFKLIINSELCIYIMMFAVTSLGLSLSSNDAIFILLPLCVLIDNNKKKLNNL